MKDSYTYRVDSKSDVGYRVEEVNIEDFDWETESE